MSGAYLVIKMLWSVLNFKSSQYETKNFWLCNVGSYLEENVQIKFLDKFMTVIRSSADRGGRAD